MHNAIDEEDIGLPDIYGLFSLLFINPFPLDLSSNSLSTSTLLTEQEQKVARIDPQHASHFIDLAFDDKFFFFLRSSLDPTNDTKIGFYAAFLAKDKRVSNVSMNSMFFETVLYKKELLLKNKNTEQNPACA